MREFRPYGSVRGALSEERPYRDSNGQFPRLWHKSNAKNPDYHSEGIGLLLDPSTLDIPPDDTWRLPMKNMILAAFAALSLTAAIAPMANAATPQGAQSSVHQGPYDNTANSAGGQNYGGGD